MNFTRILNYCLLTIITSMYFFPFEFTFLRGINTKMAMAGIGLVMLFFDLARSKSSVVNKDFFILSVYALFVSFVGLFSIVYNNTSDFGYATYIVSMWVWSGAAYLVISFMRRIHGYVSVVLVCNYLIVVCVTQCIIALMIDNLPAFEYGVNQVVAGLGFVDLKTLDDLGRLYGIGVSVDVAGSRFSAVLIMIAYILTHIKNDVWRLNLYIISMVIIGFVGNMISRTTTVGLIICLAYIIYESHIYKLEVSSSIKKIFTSIVFVAMVSVPIIIYLYNTDIGMRNNIRFAFEGFFSLAEKGTWDVHSNEILKDMYVFPDNIKTWIIGDGYFGNPVDSEPYYIGHSWKGFYHDTDVGYLRFIYYFGIVGLFLFSAFFIKVGHVLITRFKRESLLFVILITLNFIIWLKVSTDIFVVYALFLMIDKEENDQYNIVHANK